jgi:hypothetical protein
MAAERRASKVYDNFMTVVKNMNVTTKVQRLVRMRDRVRRAVKACADRECRRCRRTWDSHALIVNDGRRDLRAKESAADRSATVYDLRPRRGPAAARPPIHQISAS